MALLLIFAGTLIGFTTGAFQFALGATILECTVTYFSFGMGVPAAIGLAKWAELKLRSMSKGPTLLQIAQTDG